VIGETLSCTSKRLIIHADDVGMCHSVNQATFRAFEKGMITSASVMVPCPWFREAAEYFREKTDLDVGIHLTFTSEWKQYRWRPLVGVDKSCGFIEKDGSFLSNKKSLTPLDQDVEAEILAQVQTAADMGINPSHLDNHQYSLFYKPETLRAYVKCARDLQLPFLYDHAMPLFQLVAVPTCDTGVVVSNIVFAHDDWHAASWRELYMELVRKLIPGLNILLVHLGFDDCELRSITRGREGWGSEWRQRDFDVLASADFAHALEDNDITLTTWKASGLTRAVPQRV
jgi:chitin disaccharide deacetylase